MISPRPWPGTCTLLGCIAACRPCRIFTQQFVHALRPRSRTESSFVLDPQLGFQMPWYDWVCLHRAAAI